MVRLASGLASLLVLVVALLIVSGGGGAAADDEPGPEDPEPDTSVSIVMVGKKAVPDARGRIRVRLRCPQSEASPPCSGRLKLALARNGRKLGSTDFSLSAGKSRKVTVRMSRPALRVFRSQSANFRVRAEATVSDAVGNEDVASTNLVAKPLAGLAVGLNPGHNGRNWSAPGVINRMVPIGGGRTKACDTTGAATNAGYPEAAFNLAVAQKLRTWLRKRGARVVMTRTGNNGVGPCIDRRARIANRADIAVSIHADGGPPGGRGFHIIRPARIAGLTEPIYAPSNELALQVRAGLDKTPLPRSNYVGSAGLIARSDIGGLRLSTVPAVLVEVANMRNAADATFISSASGRTRISLALGAGIQAYLARDH